MATCGERAELKGGDQILGLEVGIVGENLLPAHPRRQEIEKHGHGVAQPPDHGLSVADLRIADDSSQFRRGTNGNRRGSRTQRLAWIG